MSDVAARAGVSRATVSRLLNNKPLAIKVGKETRKRVFDAVRELGYRPNRLAQSLMTSKKHVVGLSMPSFLPPDYAEARWVDLHSAGVGKLVCGIESVTQPRGYDIYLLERYEYRRDEPSPTIEPGLDFVDGVIYATPNPKYDRYTPIIELGIPLVMIGPNPGRHPTSYVCVENDSAIRRITRALLIKGHTRIALLLPEEPHDVLSHLRLKGFKEAYAELGVPAEEQIVVPGYFGKGAGRKLACQVLEASPRPTAIIIARKDLAFDVLEETKRRGLQCPEDIELIVYGDDHAFDTASPTLTALDIGEFHLAAQAAALLIAEMEGRAEPGRPVHFPGRLRERESCRLPDYDTTGTTHGPASG